MPRPTSTHEQREACRAIALVVGVREAARRLGLSESRVQSWSARYAWFPNRNPSHPNLAPLGISDVATIATNGANLLQNYGKTTRLHLASAADKASERFEAMPADEIIDRAEKLGVVTKVASTIHGWNEAQATSALNLNVLSGGRAIVQVNDKQTNDSQSNDIQTGT